MTEIEESKRDYEFCGIIKNPFVSLKFYLTVEDFEVDIVNGYKSPEIELHGAKLKFTLMRKNYQEFNIGFFDSIGIWSVSSMTVSGKVMVNEKKHSFPNTKLKPGQNTCVVEFPSLSNISVVKFVFDLQVYGLAKKEFLFAKKCEPKTDPDRCRKILQDNLQTLWQSQRFSDVRIQAGKEYIPAHKIILSARSPVFARMFQPPSVESTGDLVDISDVSFPIMEKLIGFLYGRFPDMSTLSEDDVIELYYASDKYQVLDLRDMCGETLDDKMTTGNVCRLIKLFDCHSDVQSIERVVDFCCVHLKDVIELEGWEVVVRENPTFCSLVMKKMAEIR